MDTQNENREMLSPYVSVDCVLLGINDDKLTVLLAERKSEGTASLYSRFVYP